MNKDDADELINNLILFSNGQIDLPTLKQIIIPNYTDINGNTSFHFLSEYTFKEFCFRNLKLNKNDKKIFTFEEYNKLKEEYSLQIITFAQTLLECNCDLFVINNNNQSPLLLNIINKNYIISKEYLNILQNVGIYTNEDYYNFLDIIILNGNCFDKDCLDLISIIISNIDEKNNNQPKLTKILISLCKNFSEKIYEKYNEIIKMVTLEYMSKDENNKIIIKQEENINQNIKNKSFKILNDYINNNFLPLFLKFIKLGANLEYDKKSAVIYLMSYPFILYVPEFIEKNKINLNVEDELGNTPLMNLMKNKEYIIQISKDIYDKSFQVLLNYINLDISIENNKNKSILYLLLLKDYYNEAKVIYNKFKNLNNSFFNSLILNFIIRKNEINKIIEFLNIFKDEIDFNLFDTKQKRSFLHYLNIFFSGDNEKNKFKAIFYYIFDNSKIDYLMKDQCDRTFLFYLFLDENDNIKINDPIKQLMYIFKKYKFNNLNEKDIFGNNLLFYIVQSKAIKCLDFLLDKGLNLSAEQEENKNSVFSISLLNGDLQIFNYLYYIIKDANVFNHKVYELFKRQNDNYESLDLERYQSGETLYNFLSRNNFNKNEISPRKKLLRNTINNNINTFNNNNLSNINNNLTNNIYNNNLYNNINKYNRFNNNNNINNYNNNYTNNNNFNNLIKLNNNNFEFNYFSFIDDMFLITLNDYTKNIIIKLGNNNINIQNIDANEEPIIEVFNKNYDSYLMERKNFKHKIISENLLRYSLSHNYINVINLIITGNYNLISACNDLILFHRHKDINECILRILLENNNEQSKLVNLRDNKGQTLYHLIPFVRDNSYFCKKLENHDISNIYDNEGNTPIFNACKNFNKNFIETFCHYKFNSENDESNNINNINYNSFLETKNNKTPLEALYEQLDKNDINLIKLIIDICIYTKKIFFIPLIKYLIINYNSTKNELYKLDYKNNLNSTKYEERIIGLYQFYTKELNGNIMIKDELGNDPFIISALNNKYDFIFKILLEEKNIQLNSTNNEGESVIHIILKSSNLSKESKKNILIKAIESGFDFNLRDNYGMLPIDYAKNENDNDLVNIFKEYYEKLNIKINKDINIIKSIKKLDFDYNKDSDTFYNESITVSMNIDKSENLHGLVTPLFKYDPIISYYQVCIDENYIPFCVDLIKKDFNVLDGFNDRKYCLQIIKDINKDDEFLTIVVDNSMLDTFTFKEFSSAKQKFKDLFKEKTNNDWDNIKNDRLNFKTDYTKYYILDYSFEEENAIYDYLKITIKNLYIQKKSELKGNIKIKNLIYYLLVKSYQNKFSIDDNELNVEQNTKNVIQRYKSTGVTKAISILFQIKNLLNSENKNEIYFKKRNYLINSYNELIPYSKNIKNLNHFDDPSNIDNELCRLTNYYYIENVLKIFLGAIYNLNNIHPLDYIITALGCKIEELPKPSNNGQLITEEDYLYNYINNTNYSLAKISAIYKITQSVNDKNYNLNNYDNRYIFFHGTKVENVIGILSQGLKIAPVQAVNTGKSFGYGIYLSDSFSLSLGYCSYPHLYYTNNLNLPKTNNKKFMFMVEVAVGKLGINADTYAVKMTMDFNKYFTTKEGYRIFKCHKNKTYGSGVIVAHDETNVRIKYLVEID